MEAVLGKIAAKASPAGKGSLKSLSVHPNGAQAMRCLGSSLFFKGIRADVIPQRIDLFGGQDASPRGHLVLSVEHRILEARTIISLQAAQIEGQSAVDEVVAMARRTIFAEGLRARDNFRLILRG